MLLFLQELCRPPLIRLIIAFKAQSLQPPADTIQLLALFCSSHPYCKLSDLIEIVEVSGSSPGVCSFGFGVTSISSVSAVDVFTLALQNAHTPLLKNQEHCHVKKIELNHF